MVSGSHARSLLVGHFTFPDIRPVAGLIILVRSIRWGTAPYHFKGPVDSLQRFLAHTGRAFPVEPILAMRMLRFAL